MAKTKRIIRKVNRAVMSSFDEQLWPINVALIVLTGFAAGIIIASSGFDDPGFWRNGWVRLATLAITVGAALWLTMKLDRRLARRLQLAALLSLIFHVCVALYLREQFIRLLAEKPDDTIEDVEPRALPTLPEYRLHAPDQPLPEEQFEKPVETETPQPTPEPPTPEEKTEQKPEAQRQPVALPDPQPETQPSPVKMQRQQRSAPRRAASTSKLSKQVEMASVQAAASVAAPQREQTDSKQAAAKLESQSGPVARSQTSTRTPPQPTAEPQTPRQQQQVAMPRRAADEPKITQSSRTPTLPKQLAKSTQTPRADVATAESAKPTQPTRPTELAPSAAVVKRSDASSPQATKADAPTPKEPSVQVATSDAARRQPSPEQPTIARTETTSPSRRPVESAVAQSASDAPARAVSRQPSPQSTPTPQKTVVARQATPAEATTLQPTLTAPSQRTAAASPAQPQRTVTSDAPKVASADAPARELKRAPDAAVAATSAATGVASTPTQQSAATSLAPGATHVSRRATSSPQTSKQSLEPTPSQTSAPAVAAAGSPNQPRNDARPSIAPSAKPVVAKAAAASKTPSTAPAMPSQVASTNANQSGATPGPQSTQVARQASQSPTATAAQASPSNLPSRQPSNSLAQATSRQSTASDRPSLNPSSRSADSPRRAMDTSAVAASPTPVESPAVAKASSQDRPTARPASSALSRAETGVVGRGQSPNADVAMKASPQNTAAVASSAARRQVASQQEAGPQLSSSAPARIAKGRAGADAPSATLTAQDVQVATAAGAAKPSELAATASAAVERSNAAAPESSVTAAAGQLEVDTGANQVVPEVGTGRAAGGGQPEIALNAQSESLEKARSGGAALAAITAEQVAAAPSAPDAGGGGSPAPPQPSLAAAEAGARGAGASLPASGQPAGGAEPAPSTGSQDVADAALARAAGGAEGQGLPKIDASEAGEMQSNKPLGGAELTAMAQQVEGAAPGETASDGGGALAAATGEINKQAAGGLPATEGPKTAEPAAGGGASGDVAAKIDRAAPTEALPGVVVGGGTAQPAEGRGVEVAMLNPAEVPQLPATPQTGGAEQGPAQAAQGLKAGSVATGLPGKATTGPVGVVAGDVAVDARQPGAPGAGVALAQASRGRDNAPAIGSGGPATSPLKQGDAAALPSGMATDAEELASAAATEAVASTMNPGAAATAEGPARASGSLPVRTVAQTGPGGLGMRFTAEVGLPSRRAQRDSQIVHQTPDKYLQKKVGGASAVTGTAASPSFARRSDRHGNQKGGDDGSPSAKTEASIEAGVDFLSRHQNPNGSWSFNGFGQGRRGYETERATIQSDTAATGLALLAFLGAGYDHFDDKYQQRVAAGLNFLLRHQQPNGDLYIAQDATTNKVAHLYSHAIATIALCEAHGMTGDPTLGEAAQKAIDFIVESQHPERGGWRYTPGYMSDLSVTGWQLMAMKSGELAGLEVPSEAYQGVLGFLERSQATANDGAFYVYNPYAPNTRSRRHGKNASTVMTSVGLLMRLYTGWNRERPEMKRGADHLLKNLPQYGTSEALTGTLSNPSRDTYYWYYATQVMYHMKGDYWKAWNDRLHPLLTDTQIKRGIMAGSWDPRRPLPDKWGLHGGRVYLTAMNLLSLEVYYRHLPIYEETGK